VALKGLSSSGWLLLALAAAAAAAPAVNVPLDHWGYGFVERFEARGGLRGIGDGIKPFSRRELALAVAAVAARQRQGLELSAVEREELRLLQEEFNAELRELGEEVPPAPGRLAGEGTLYQYTCPQGDLQADLVVRQQSDLFAGRGRQETERVFRNRLGGAVRGHFADRIGYRISFLQTREQGSRSYFLRDDVYERRLEALQLKGDLADFHEGMAYLTFSLPAVDVELGKDQVSWGPAPGDNLGLSRNAPSFDMIRLRARYGAFKLVSVAGFLRPCPQRPDSPICGSGETDAEASYIADGTARTLEREKRLAAHRLEVALAPWIDLGFQEVVVYGDRGLEPTYLNPIMFYWAAQSYLGDKDNLMMGVDVDLHARGVRAYFAYVVDDLKKARIFSSDFANKFSFQTGLLWVDPVGRKDTDLRVEYVRIEPWIYTHKFPVNTFRHFDSPLGHSLGPNSDRWQVRLERRFVRGLSVELALNRTRHGDNELLADGSVRNVGGDLHLGPGGEARARKKFLDGQLSRRTALGGKGGWRVRPHLFIEAGYEREWGKGVPLPPRWGSGVALKNRTGYGDGGQQHFHFELRYGYL